MSKPRCAYVWGGERCPNPPMVDNEGGKCADCGKNHCREHIVPDWHLCGVSAEDRKKMEQGYGSRP